MKNNNKASHLRKNRRGFGVIEAAILLPLFLLISLGGIDLGWMMVNRFAATSAASTVANALQANPTTSGSELDSIFRNAGFGLMNGGASCLAAQSYENKPDIETVKALACDTLNPGDPTPATPTAPYYIGVKVQFVYTPLSPIGASFLGESKTVTTASIYRYQQPLTPPVCTGTGNALQFQNGAWVCVQTQNTPPNCTGEGKALQFQNGAWVCSSTPPDCTGYGNALQFKNGAWECGRTIPDCDEGSVLVKDVRVQGNNWKCKRCPDGTVLAADNFFSYHCGSIKADPFAPGKFRICGNGDENLGRGCQPVP
ncbi:MAG: TadE/TadG family type IV pilus assembly protein [Holosporales bacterium]